MNTSAYRDGVGEHTELEVEREELSAAHDHLLELGLVDTPELTELRTRMMRPLMSSVDVAERHADLRAFDAELEARWAVHEQAPMRRRVRIALLGGLAALVLSASASLGMSHLGVKVSSASDCHGTPACAREGRCSPSVAGILGLAQGDFACVARTDADCIRACSTLGLCVVEDGVCVSRDYSCANSDACRQDGVCGVSGKVCAPERDAHCSGSHGCKLEGACGIALNKTCQPLSDAHCEESFACSQAGRCSVGLRNGVPACVRPFELRL